MNISWTEITRHENPKLLKLANIHKTMNSFCKMIGQLLQTELDPLTTVSYTASACSSELTASVVSWTASALKCTQQTTRCKKSQSNWWICLQSSSNDMHWNSQNWQRRSRVVQELLLDTAANLNSAYRWTSRPRVYSSDKTAWRNATGCKISKKQCTSSQKGAHTSIRGLWLIPWSLTYFGRKTSGRRLW